MDRSRSAVEPSVEDAHRGNGSPIVPVVRLRRPPRPRKDHDDLELNCSPRAHVWDFQLGLRMLHAAENLSWKEIAARTGDHPENVRRHMGNGRVSARFLAQFCVALELEPRWLLLGEGPMRKRVKR